MLPMDADEFLGPYATTPPMDVDEFLGRYADGEREFSGVNLSKAMLNGRDLRRVKLINANLSQTFLSGVDLRGARLARIYLSSANLNGADLRGVMLFHSQLCLTKLNGADLSGAQIVEANLNAASLRGAKLCGAYIDSVDLSDACLEETDFSGAEFSNAWHISMGKVKIRDDVVSSSDAIANGAVSNQGIPFYPNSPIYTWETFRFRSKSEIKIAEALDRVKVLFLPNCLTRLNHPHKFGGRGNLEPDFLVCHQGKWGILEVDGPWHKPQRRVDEQERERLFQLHGIRVIQRFDSSKCESEPDSIVKKFLEMIENMYQI